MTTDQAKQISLISLLEWLGFEAKRQSSTQFVYTSPFNPSEQTPSFYVHPERNVFNCFSTGKKGDVIRFVQEYKNLSFHESINYLQASNLSHPVNSPIENPSFLFSGKIHHSPSDGIVIETVKPLQHPALIQYLESRKVPFALARQYVHQVHYQNAKGRFFSIGFANDKGGFELRNQHFKGSTSPKAITSFVVEDAQVICLFEGFFDFLSALVYYNRSKPRFTTIVLNSTANLTQALPLLQSCAQVNVFFDRDKGGMAAIEQLTKQGVPTKDCSIIYENFKDFNDLLINSQ